MFSKKFILACLGLAVMLGACLPLCAEETVMLERVDFRGLALRDAFRVLAAQTKMNLVATPDAGKTEISIYLSNVPAEAAIEEICKSNNLWFRKDEKSGIVRVMTVQEFQRNLVTFREEKTEVFTLLYPNSIEIGMAIRDLFGSRVQLSFGREGQREDQNDLESRFDRFDLIDQRSQGIGLFGSDSGLGGTNGRSGSVGSSSAISTRSQLLRSEAIQRNVAGRESQPNRNTDGSELRTLTAEQAQSVQKALEKDPNSPEAQLALQPYVNRQADIFVTLNRRNNLVLVRTSDLKALEEIRVLIKRLDIPTPMVMLEVKVLSLDLSDGFDSVFDFQMSNGRDTAAGFTSGNIVQPPADFVSGTAKRLASLTPGGTGLNPTDLIFQFVNDNFRARLQALETKNRVTTIATPLLLTSNNEVSRLFIGEERPIIRNISSNVTSNNNTTTTAPNTTVEFRPVGTTLLITPSINSDGTVTMRLLQENSTINKGGATIPVVSGSGLVQNQVVDVVATRTVSGTIVAKHGLCVAVGGLIEENVADTRSQVPVLGKIPVMGILFRKQNTERGRHEMVILVRPFILSTPAEADEIRKKLNSELSIHPKAQDPVGTLDTFTPPEVPRPNPPKELKDSIFRLHSVKPGDRW